MNARGETLTMIRRVAGTPDAHNVAPYIDGATVPIPGCGWAPATGSDIRTNDRDGVRVDATAYLPSDAPQVGPHDMFDRPDGRYAVVGFPGVWNSRYRRRTVGTVVTLQRAEG